MSPVKVPPSFSPLCHFHIKKIKIANNNQGRGYLPKTLQLLRTYLPGTLWFLRTYFPRPLRLLRTYLLGPFEGIFIKKII
jgi:hypothetical protein